MGFGLSAFQQQEEKRTERAESPYFKLEPGQKVKIRPLVELDEDADGFDPERKTANFVKEYVNPVKFWLSIVDTYPTEGQCVGFEMTQKFGWFKGQGELKDGQHSDKTKNWNPKTRFYLPVVVDRMDGSEPTAEVLQLTYGERSWAWRFIEQHSAKNTIVDRWFIWGRNNVEVGKNGGIQDVAYTLVPDDPSEFDVSEFELPDVFDAPYVNNVPYDQQHDFLQIDQTYNKGGQGAESSAPSEQSESAPADSGSSRIKW